MSKHFYILPAQVFDGDQLHQNLAVEIDSGRISRLRVADNLDPTLPFLELPNCTLAPGFIDWQANGGGGVLFNNEPTFDGLTKIAKAHCSGGTTSFFPTIVTDTFSVRRSALSAVREAKQRNLSAVLGIHFEGPYFANARRGVHNEGLIASPEEEELDFLTDNADVGILLTFAPEKLTSPQVSRLAKAGVLLSLGHSDANFDQAQLAIDLGARAFTHLFNAMSQANSREPGMVGAALLNDQAWCGLIADGVHVSKQMIDLTLRSKPNNKICLVTDAMATVGSEVKSFRLYGETILEKNGVLHNSEGRLAGAAISMIDAVKFMHEEVKVELTQVLRMASLYPAQMVGCDASRGRIAPDYLADLVAFDKNFEVKQTWVGGIPQLTD